MIYAIYVALGVVAFLTILNGFLMGAKKRQIDILLSFLLVGLVVAAFAVAGWKLGILAIGIVFLSAIFTRSIAARTASRLFALSTRGGSGPVGLPPRRLQTISQQLGRPIDPNQIAKEMFSGSNRSTDALTALLDYCESQPVIEGLMNEFQISRDDLRELYYDLLRSGAGQWVCGHYVAASALAYPEPLRYMLVRKRNNGSFNIETASNVIMYFEQGSALQV
jgi:hypothetical protein